MLKTIRTNFDRQEMRRDRRYPLPAMVVSFAGGDYETVNWSLSGFLLSGGPAVAIGSTLPASLRIHKLDQQFDCQAEAVRHDSEANGVAFRFVDPTALMVTALDRVMARHMVGARRR